MRVLIVRTDRIGDMILTLPMATAIKCASPQHEVIMLARSYTEPVVALCPDVDEIVLLDGDSGKATANNPSTFKIAAQLRRLQADAIIIPSPKPPLALAALLSGIKLRVGTGYRWYSFCFNKKIFDHRRTAEFNEAEYNVRMLSALGLPSSEYPLPVLQKDRLPSGSIGLDRYIVLHTGTGGSAPIWDKDRWYELAAAIRTVYQLPIILTGTENDAEFLFILAQRMKQAGIDVHIQTKNSLAALMKLLADATLVIAGSTGPGHLAAALGAATIGLFPLRTVLSKERWGFRGKRVVNLSPHSAPKVECPTCKDCRCIDQITIDDVITAAQTLLTNGTGN